LCILLPENPYGRPGDHVFVSCAVREFGGSNPKPWSHETRAGRSVGMMR
jgi:hypothetical protein